MPTGTPASHAGATVTSNCAGIVHSPTRTRAPRRRDACEGRSLHQTRRFRGRSSARLHLPSTAGARRAATPARAQRVAPSLRELADEVGLASPSSVLHHVRVLEHHGAIERRAGAARTVTATGPPATDDPLTAAATPPPAVRAPPPA
ncbi:hypothetical protein [Egicoccus halophilus]|uniref:LexA family protein n=1 Tax=Egicoccus halophilus TaxID=1670830 RepID=UPI0010304095